MMESFDDQMIESFDDQMMTSGCGFDGETMKSGSLPILHEGE